MHGSLFPRIEAWQKERQERVSRRDHERFVEGQERKWNRIDRHLAHCMVEAAAMIREAHDQDHVGPWDECRVPACNLGRMCLGDEVADA